MKCTIVRLKRWISTTTRIKISDYQQTCRNIHTGVQVEYASELYLKIVFNVLFITGIEMRTIRQAIRQKTYTTCNESSGAELSATMSCSLLLVYKKSLWLYIRLHMSAFNRTDKIYNTF